MVGSDTKNFVLLCVVTMLSIVISRIELLISLEKSFSKLFYAPVSNVILNQYVVSVMDFD